MSENSTLAGTPASPPLGLAGSNNEKGKVETTADRASTMDRTISHTEPVNPNAVDKELQATRTKSHQLREGASDAEHAEGALAKLGNARKNFLLFIFSVATFIDICKFELIKRGTRLQVAQISVDIKLDTSQIVWIITSYSLCFAAFLLFAGRLSDLFPAQIVFEAGFFILGILSLVTSFVTSNKYGFLILRGLGGIAGSMTIPSAYHLTVHMFPEPKEQQAKLALLGLAGAVGNVLGLVLAGICMLANYRWFFRVLAIICVLFTVICIWLLPFTGSTYQPDPAHPRWKRLDIIGVALMMGSLITFILSLTQGPIDGWGSASFIAPFVLSFPLAFAFFFWESKIPPKSAVLPSSVWKITNIIIASLGIGIAFPFWATSQLLYATWFQQVFGWTPIHVAAAMLPQGITGLLIGGMTQAVPQIITKPRYSMAIGGVLIIAAELLQVFSNGGAGKDYWRFCFPAYIIGSAGAVITYFASAINLISYCPPEMAGVAGAWTQVVAQIAGAITLAVQASFEGDGIRDWKMAGRRSFYFQIAWTAILTIQYLVFYKQPGTPEEEHEAARKRIRDSGKDAGLL
ncbi:efflux protein EncT [Kwoniella heveanensis CBS 569]|uniref:Efflux protein EncT n=1 Tax=Kwoniella heveanensis BCC8398 TaxID=1296120 RepID=A0A1B9GZU2_9TREE|nr:efflux protein EncT [Kwoniella heveanensis BCC8398]OCF45466.1 efflux protein EncT [Kwoniella heveanensis CBS 569]